MEWIYAHMGELGWETPVVDEMELWQIGRFLGLPAGTRPVIRGSRGLQLDTTPRAPAVPDPRTIDRETWGTDAKAEAAMLAMMRSRR